MRTSENIRKPRSENGDRVKSGAEETKNNSRRQHVAYLRHDAHCSHRFSQGATPTISPWSVNPKCFARDQQIKKLNLASKIFCSFLPPNAFFFDKNFLRKIFSLFCNIRFNFNKIIKKIFLSAYRSWFSKFVRVVCDKFHSH